MSLFDWLANLPFVWVLAIAVGLYALRAFFARTLSLPVNIRKFWGESVESLLFAWVVVFLILKPLLLQAFYIPSQSMEPTLSGHKQGEPTGQLSPEFYDRTVHDRLLVGKFPYYFTGPKRGDIVVFKAPPNADPKGVQMDYIKRLIGLPGEKLAVIGGRVYINDKPLEEPYTMESSGPDFGPLVIPEAHYFMMGDNRLHSADSRYWGPLHKKRVVGKALFRFWPLGKIGFLPAAEYNGVAARPQPALGIPGVLPL